MTYRTYPMHLDRLSDKSGSVVKVVEKGGDIAKALFVVAQPTPGTREMSQIVRDTGASASAHCVTNSSLACFTRCM